MAFARDVALLLPADRPATAEDIRDAVREAAGRR